MQANTAGDRALGRLFENSAEQRRALYARATQAKDVALLVSSGKLTLLTCGATSAYKGLYAVQRLEPI